MFSDCVMFFEEQRQYHRGEDGKIVRINDDVLDAVRYGIMMLRFAEVPAPKRFRRTEQINPMLGF